MLEYGRIKREIYECLQNYSRILQIPAPKLAFSSNKTFGGEYSKNLVTLNRLVIENWDNERKVCEFILVHELIHAKYNESSIVVGLMSFFCPSVSVKLAFSELRANTMAYEITGSNESVLEHYFTNFYFYNKIPFISYSGGYLKGQEYVEFIRQHQKWTTQTIENASIYFKNYCLWYKLVSLKKYLQIQQKFS
ncbi:MAG: hypothetical protein ABS949_12065 [Solibacillus sp.]